MRSGTTVNEHGSEPLPPLPVHPTSFIGRASLLAEIHRRLAQTRLLTLSGPGGCGKTRLALHVAAALAGSSADGACWVALDSVADPALVAETVAIAAGVREQPGRSLAGALVEHFASREALLVLDNCEHLLDASAALAATLLRACPGLRLLTTSREALAIDGETVLLVPPLSLPDPDALPGLEAAGRSEAVQLFVERAAALSAFALSEANIAAVVQICRRLDGLPLAIELAAARTRVLSVEQIAARLDDCFSLLSSHRRTSLPRQQTLRATLDWSHALLTEPEQTLFRRLAVFAGGCTIAAIEYVCSGEPIAREPVLDLLSRLVEKSLVAVDLSGVEARYHLLETIRQYAEERLRAAGEEATLHRRHAGYYHDLAVGMEPLMKTRERRRRLAQLEAAHDNLRAALTWAAEHREAAPAVRLATSLFWFWFYAGGLSEGRRWLERAAAGTGTGGDDADRARARSRAGFLAWAQGDYAAARTLAAESVPALRASEDGSALGHALAYESMAELALGNLDGARRLGEESVETLRDGDQFDLAFALSSLGVVLVSQQDYAAAARTLQEAVALFAEAGDAGDVALPLSNLGIIELRKGDYRRAVARFRESLSALRPLGEKYCSSQNLELLASALARLGEHGRAARLFGAGEALRASVGASSLPFYQADYDAGLEAARAGLGAEAFALAWAAGRVMSLDEAIADALAEHSAPRLAVGDRDPREPLRIYALGLARVERGGRRLTAADFTYARPRELLFYLLTFPRHRREQIGFALWPDASPAQLRAAFHNALHHLRRALGAAGWVRFEDGRYAFDRTGSYSYDVEDFERALAAAERARRDDSARAIEHLQCAVAAYGGEFLDDFCESDWCRSRRAVLSSRYDRALFELGRLLFAAGRYAAAVETYQRLIARDSLCERAHRELIRCYAGMGEPGQALRQYDLLVALLREELDAAPAAETAALAATLRRDTAHVRVS